MRTTGLDETLRWFSALKETSNKAFLPLYFCKSRYLVLKGGGGSGKSNFAAHKLLCRCAAEGGHRFLVCRRYKTTIRRSCFDQLCALAAQYYPEAAVKINLSTLSLIFPSGSMIICSGLDDVEKLKSIYEITDIWIEEATEITEADFNQLDIRMRGASPYYRQMMLTFNPVSINHWLKKRFFDERDPRATVHESTYLDNAWLSEEDRETLRHFQTVDPYYYEVYCLGKWGSVFRSIFQTDKLVARRAALQPPERVGWFADGKFTESPDGGIKIYREPVRGRPYVLGADTAGEGSDFFAAHVVDNLTGEQVAVLHARIDETAFPPQIYALGVYYNTALVAVECNFSTYTVRKLEEMGYPKQYVRERFDDYTHRPKKAFGFVTDKLTRPVILAELVAWVAEHPECLCDEATIEEMLTFVRNEKLRAEAAEGAHDDLVLSLAITLSVRGQQTSEDVREKARWTRGMIEDYKDADAEERRDMVKLFGRPPKR